MKTSLFTILLDHFCHGARIFALLHLFERLVGSMAFWTAAEVSRSIFAYARTSSRFDTAPCPGITLTSAGNVALTVSHVAIMPCTLPPGGHVDERKAVANEDVAHVHHVILHEEDDRVAVGVRRRKVHRANVLAVQMHGEVVVKRDDRQGALRLGRRLRT